jgi:hypothetical protein
MEQNDLVFDTWSDATIARDIQKNLRPSPVASGKVSREEEEEEEEEEETTQTEEVQEKATKRKKATERKESDDITNMAKV